MQISPARVADIPAMAALHEASIRQDCGPFYSEAQIDEWVGHQDTEHYAQVLTERVALIAVDSGRVLGFGSVTPAAGFLNTLYVAPDAMHRGVGSALLHALEVEARAAGANALKLRSTLNAATFYESHGWRRVGTVTHSFPSGLAIDSVEFVLELGEAHV